MKTAVVLLALLPLAAAAQPLKVQDRHPAYTDDPIKPRVVPIETIHSFEQRWEPVYEMLDRQRIREKHPVWQNAPAAISVPLSAPLPSAKVADRARDLCERHGLRKVTTNGGRSWRCR